ncbi:hypothetical protein GCM10009679_27240 [Saccharothrix algeriensis]|uniref:Uncharacterized protein n=3 Tax=Catellatospora bangladeshensis TaxID=310355 RepID=A0A8J3JGC2_9ACTN|nr:hypothetical protein Cba03nite_14950 [Catellatospora bangladeshensis]
MVAARIPMSRTGFEGWLSTPLPGVEAVENPDAMWRGWGNDGAAADWALGQLAAYPAVAAGILAARAGTPLDRLAERAAGGMTLARHRDGALEVYLYDYHGDSYGTQTDLLMLAGAGRFADAGAESAVLHWGGHVYPDLPLSGDQPLAVLLVGSAAARFAYPHPVPALIEHLRPVEADFLAAVAACDDGAEWDPAGLVDPAILARSAAQGPR